MRNDTSKAGLWLRPIFPKDSYDWVLLVHCMSEESLPPPQKRAKEHQLRKRGFWSGIFDELLFLCPEYVERYADLSSHPGEVLDGKVKELIHIAIDCSTTHLYYQGTRAHINNAFDKGATIDEILEVFILSSTIGIHTSSMGANILIDEQPENLDSAEGLEKLKTKLGYWTPDFDSLSKVDSRHLEHYAELSAIAWEDGPLPRRIKHLILLVLEINPTRGNKEISQIHARNALEEGAKFEEVLATIETASVLGVHSMDNVAILVEEAARRGELPEELKNYPEYISFRDPRYL